MIVRVVDVHADLTKVEVRRQGRLVAAHDRLWARGRTITDPAHAAATNVLRKLHQLPRTADPDDAHQGLARDLADYDRAFGVIDGGLSTGPVEGEEVA